MTKKIMVVDDEASIREIISELLREFGHKVLAAVDGQDAYEKMQIEPCDLYIIDLFMPRIQGLELIEKILEFQSLAVIIVITGFSSIDTAIKAIRKGAYHYITKPINAEELIKSVNAGLSYAEELNKPVSAEDAAAAEYSPRLALMRGFSPEQQQDFKLMGTVDHYRSGQKIPLDEESGSLIWLESGRIGVLYNNCVVDSLQEGDIWGEENFISPNALFTELVAQSEVQIRRFKRKRILEFFTYHDQLTNRYMINLFQSIYLKWRKCVHKLGIYGGFNKG